MKFLSSIFNSEQLADLDIPRDWWASMALLAGVLVFAELAARVLMAPVGENLWSYGTGIDPVPFEWFRVLGAEGRTPTIVVIGDSTAARNLDPTTLAEASMTDSVYSLAYPGNFPRALRSNTLPLLKSGNTPEIVILFQWPGALKDDPRVDQIEAGAISPILEARMTGRLLISEFLYITRLFPARIYLVNHWLRGKTLIHPPGRNGFVPLDRPARAQNQASIEIPPTGGGDFSDQRREVIRELIALAKKRDFLLVAIVGPFRSGDQYLLANMHLEWLREQEKNYCENLLVMDLRQMPGIGPELFKDNHHLYADGAQVFSVALGQKIASIREHSLPERAGCTRL
jgi:hypothetical protein